MNNKNKITREDCMSAIKTIIKYFEGNSDRDGLKKTPERVFKSYEETLSGYNKDPSLELKSVFEKENSYSDMVIVKGIDIVSKCEHHMLPIIGTADIAYLPNNKIVGISKLARVADIFSRRLQTQENLTSQIAECIYNNLDCLGVAVLIDARHSCMSIRGTTKTNSTTVTSCMLGEFSTNNELKKEFYAKLK